MPRTLVFYLALALAASFGAREALARAPAAPLPMDPGAPIQTKSYGSTTLQDGKHDLGVRATPDTGLLVPDLEGNYVLIPSGKRPDPDPALIQAQELKLKVREMVSQLLESWPNDALFSAVALPTTFVSLHDFNQTSPLGRYLAEALFYEFNTRGFATREYRVNGRIRMEPDGEFALSRDLPDVIVNSPNAVLVVGTYHRDREAVFVNARMVRASDGLVLRTAQLVLGMNPLLTRMSAEPPLRSGVMRINPGARPVVAAPRK